MLVTRESCEWEGNPDLYGIGVRAGLYAQWTATLLATVFDQRSEGVLRITNLIIQFAIFIGLCTESTKSGNAVGSVITQFLLCGSLSSVTGDGITNLNKVSGLMRIIFYMALSAYGCWFWFTGVGAMTQTSCRHIAFFGRASFTGWFRSLGKALSVMGLISCVCLCGVCGFFVYKRFRGGLAGLHEDRKRPRVEIVLMLLSMGLIAFSVAIVEYLISVNEPKGEITTTVSSVGQLIPLIAGTMACGMMLWRVVAGGLMWKKRCWFLFRCHL